MTRWLAPAILLLALSACEPSGSAPREVATASIGGGQAEALFLQKCAICHGDKGDGRGPRRGSLFAEPPDFRRPAWREGKSLAELRAQIRDGRPGSDMPAWKNLSDAEVAGLAEYIARLSESSAAPR